MKRRFLFLMAFVLVVLAGCNREQAADLILFVAYQPTANSTHNSEKNALARADAHARPFLGDAAIHPELAADQSLAALAELQRLVGSDDGSTINAEKLNDLVQRVAGFRAVANSDVDRQQAGELQLAALAAAAELQPDLFVQKRDDFCREELHQEFGQFRGAEGSAMRLLTGHLAAKQLSPEVGKALKFHAATYPQCAMNGRLFSTLIERLVNEKQYGLAVQVANDGLKYCSQPGDGEKFQAQLDRILREAPTSPGIPMRLAGNSAEGTPIDIHAMLGHIVVVTFWESSDNACREEITNLKKLYGQYQTDGVALVGVSLDADKTAFTSFLADNGIKWSQIFYAKRNAIGFNSPFAKFFRIQEVPYTIVVDRSGKIAASGLRGEAAIETAILDQLAD